MIFMTCAGVALAIFMLYIGIQEGNRLEAKGCEYTGNTKMEMMMVYNVTLKMSIMQPVTKREYTCPDGEEGWW